MKKKILAAALIVLAVALVGSSLAYFTDTDRAKNIFTVGNVDITLDEAQVIATTDINGLTTWKANNSLPRVTANTYNNIYPGAILPKDPAIHNIGTNSAYVRMKVVINNAADWNIAPGADLSAIFAGHDETLWTRVGDITVDVNGVATAVYTYNSILEGGESTAPLFAAINVPTTIQNGQISDFEINVTADAIQAEGFIDSASAWAAFN